MFWEPPVSELPKAPTKKIPGLHPNIVNQNLWTQGPEICIFVSLLMMLDTEI